MVSVPRGCMREVAKDERSVRAARGDIRVKGIVSVVLSSVSFANHRLSGERLDLNPLTIQRRGKNKVSVGGNRTVSANLCTDCRQSFFVTLRDCETFHNSRCITYLTDHDHDQNKPLDTGKTKAFWTDLLLG